MGGYTYHLPWLAGCQRGASAQPSMSTSASSWSSSRSDNCGRAPRPRGPSGPRGLATAAGTGAAPCSVAWGPGGPAGGVMGDAAKPYLRQRGKHVSMVVVVLLVQCGVAQ